MWWMVLELELFAPTVTSLLNDRAIEPSTERKKVETWRIKKAIPLQCIEGMHCPQDIDYIEFAAFGNREQSRGVLQKHVIRFEGGLMHTWKNVYVDEDSPYSSYSKCVMCGRTMPLFTQLCCRCYAELQTQSQPRVMAIEDTAIEDTPTGSAKRARVNKMRTP
jgi:hypothetical protein